MMNIIKKKCEKGITLIALVFTILIMIIITSTIAVNAYSHIQLSNLTKLDNDIKILNDRVAAYFVEHDDLPASKIFNNVDEFIDSSYLSSNDNETYYIIDLSELGNPTLNYGKDYETLLSQDVYIINEETHIIYYLKGVAYNGEVYYTIRR